MMKILVSMMLLSGALSATAQAIPEAYTRPSKTHATDRLVQRGRDLEPACWANLEGIRDAIADYRRDKGELPLWLSDLVREGYVEDPNLLVCPVTVETGHAPTLALYFPDPKIEGSYLFEYTPSPIGPGRTPGEVLTMRAWKERCERLVGGVVPLVRCILHDRVLNLSVDGSLYESQLNWEDKVEDPNMIPKLQMFADEEGVSYDRDWWREADAAWSGVQAPSFSLPRLGEGEVRLEDLVGKKVVVLEFWNSRLPVSVDALSIIEEVWASYEDRPVELLAVSWREDPVDISRVLGERELSLPVAVDSSGMVAMTYGVRGGPRTVIIGLDGVVQTVRSGFYDDYRKFLREEIDRALRDR